MIEAYLEKLPADRRTVIRRMQALVRKHLPKGYVETSVPPAKCIATYEKAKKEA